MIYSDDVAGFCSNTWEFGAGHQLLSLQVIGLHYYTNSSRVRLKTCTESLLDTLHKELLVVIDIKWLEIIRRISKYVLFDVDKNLKMLGMHLEVIYVFHLSDVHLVYFM